MPSPTSLSSHGTTGMDKTISGRRRVDPREVCVSSLTFWFPPFANTVELTNPVCASFLRMEIAVRSFVQMSKDAVAQFQPQRLIGLRA